MKTFRLILVLFLGITIVGCNNTKKPQDSKKTETEKIEDDTFKIISNLHPGTDVVWQKFEALKIKKDGKDVWIRHGKQWDYYKNGKLRELSEFRNNKREGVAYQYYEDGVKIYFERNFVNGNKDGIVKKYYRSGNIMSETPYKQDMLGTGTKEYADKADSKPLTMPELKVWAQDNRREKGTYIVNAKVVDKFGKTLQKVEFFEGMLLQQDGVRYEHPGLKSLTPKAGVASITYYESTGFPNFVSITARVTTSKGTLVLLNEVLTVN
jgi:antitoxin component YwqK of YwqJK toxin-antitoxin module